MTVLLDSRERQLTGHDRCDRCSARALYLCLSPDLELTFCGHHGMVHYNELVEQGFTIFDQSTAQTDPEI